MSLRVGEPQAEAAPLASSTADRRDAPAAAALGVPGSPGPVSGASLAGAILATLPAAALVAGLALWLRSLGAIDLGRLAAAGLPGIAPAGWWAALALLLGGAVAATCSTHQRPALAALLVLGVVAVLYATVPALSAAPPYAWTYKHIGVVRLIELRGATSSTVDLYNRWPGLFALAATLARVSGTDPLRYAAWVTPAIAALDAALVAAVGRTITGDARVGAMAALLFTCTDWVGQLYFSPQTLAYTLDLALVLLLLTPSGAHAVSRTAARYPVSGKPARRPAGQPAKRPVGQHAGCLAGQHAGRPGRERRHPPPAVVPLALVLQAAIVVTHQLTPYMVSLQAAVLVALGRLRPRWLPVAMAAMSLAYLIPNFAFLRHHYGLLTGLNPLANAAVTPGVPVHRAWLFAHSGLLLSAIAMASALAGLARRARIGDRRDVLGLAKPARWARMGDRRDVLAVAGLMLAPFAVLAGGDYGGEAALRVFLFCAPWCAVGAAWGLVDLRPRLRALLGAGLLAGAAGLFTVAALGNAQTDVIPAGEVQASAYFDAHAPAGSVLLLAGEDFPMRVGARYAVMADPVGGDNAPDLLEDLPALRSRRVGPADAAAVVRDLRSYSRTGFVVFSRTQDAYAADFDTTTPGALAGLEHVVARSPRFSLWYANADARIYRLR